MVDLSDPAGVLPTLLYWVEQVRRCLGWWQKLPRRERADTWAGTWVWVGRQAGPYCCKRHMAREIAPNWIDLEGIAGVWVDAMQW